VVWKNSFSLKALPSLRARATSAFWFAVRTRSFVTTSLRFRRVFVWPSFAIALRYRFHDVASCQP